MSHVDEIISIDYWIPIEDFGTRYPEGAREKTLYRSPQEPTQSYIKADHRYLFKESNQRYPWQFWCEIIAYRIGLLMNVDVPSAFVASKTEKDGKDTVYAVLIEWFYEDAAIYEAGGDLMAPRIPTSTTRKANNKILQPY
jgi:hypothetical protein